MRTRSGRMLSVASSLTIAALCGAACAVLLPAASGSHGQNASCGPIGAQTVVADSAARVYRVPTGHDGLWTLYNYDGCTVGNAKSQLLARSALSGVRLDGCAGSACRVVRAIRLVAATVGVIVEQHGLDSVSTTLTVRDLAGGDVLHTVQTYSLLVIGVGERLITYALAPSGNIAWATVCQGQGVCGSDGQRPTSVATIHRAIGHTVSTLDKGPKVRASSLRLRGDTVLWIDGGKQRTASLP